MNVLPSRCCWLLLPAPPATIADDILPYAIVECFTAAAGARSAMSCCLHVAAASMPACRHVSRSEEMCADMATTSLFTHMAGANLSSNGTVELHVSCRAMMLSYGVAPTRTVAHVIIAANGM